MKGRDINLRAESKHHINLSHGYLLSINYVSGRVLFTENIAENKNTWFLSSVNSYSGLG